MENPRRFALSCVLLVLMLVTRALVLQVAADSGRGTAPHGVDAPSELEAPTNLAAVGYREGHIDLTWQDNSSDETSFVAEYSLDGVTGWSTATSGIAANATTVRIGAYDCESTRYYRLRAHRSGDNQYSGYSNVAGGTTGPCRPSDLMVTSVSESQITLGWTDNSSTETHFQIARSMDGSTDWDPPHATVAADETTYQDSMLTCSTRYYYLVRAYRNTDGVESGASYQVSVATLPCAPDDLVAATLSPNEVRLIWEDQAPDETAFNIERSLGGVSEWAQVAVVPADTTSYVQTGLDCDTGYQYRVRAYRGDVDILGAAYIDDHILWWENDGSGGYDSHFIDPSFNYARSVYAKDVDGDGDQDVLGASWYDDEITWWRNEGGGQFTTHVISNTFDGAYSVYASDLDGDNDVDVLGAACEAGDIAWWENDGNESFDGHIVEDNFGAAAYVVAADLDQDGDVDILAAGYNVDHLSWFENDGQENFARHTVVADYEGARSAVAADLDDDGDLDIIGTAEYDADVSWFENDGDEHFTRHVVTDTFTGARLSEAADLDGDGDLDLVGAAAAENSLVWWENDGSESFSEHVFNGDLDGAIHFHIADVDSDGILDVVGAGFASNEFAWWRNDGAGEFTKHSLDTSYEGPAAVHAVDLDGDSSHSAYSNVAQATTNACPVPIVLIPLAMRDYAPPGPPCSESYKTTDKVAINDGDTIKYRFVVKNSGTEPMTWNLYDDLPTGLKYLSTESGPCRYSYGEITGNGTLEPGESRTCSFLMRVYAYENGIVKNVATLSCPDEILLEHNLPVMVTNGSFEYVGTLGWTVSGDSVLPAPQVVDWAPVEGNLHLKLGEPNVCLMPDPDAQGDHASIAKQSIYVPDVEGTPVLDFQYRIFTFDHLTWTEGQLGDSFDVYVGGTQALRDNYENFPDTAPKCNNLQDSGWRQPDNPWGGQVDADVLDLSEWKGQSVEVRFELWTRHDGHYNTWAYLDDVRVEIQP